MKTYIIACSVMRTELEEVLNGASDVEPRYLEQALHRTPQLMAGRIQAVIDEVAPSAARIILGYGLCSNGITGVIARNQGLIVPRCHDCIALFLGSCDAYNQLFSESPGTYYLTPGWIAEKKDPIGIVEEDYTQRVGAEAALWVMQEELKHYTHIALIRTGIGDIGPYRERAQKNAEFFGKEYRELEGNLDFFRKLLIAHTLEKSEFDKDFVLIPPGTEIRQEMFFDLAC